MTKDFYLIKDEMTAEHKQYLKNLGEAKDKTEAEFKVQADKYDKLVADKNKEIMELDTKKKGILKDLDNMRLENTQITQEKVSLENKRHALRITLQGEEVAFKAKVDAWEKEKEKILDDRRKEKDSNAKLRAECEAERMAGQAKERNAEKILAQAQELKAEALRIKDDAGKQILEAQGIRDYVVTKLTEIEAKTTDLSKREEAVAIAVKESARLKDWAKALDLQDIELKKKGKEQEEKAVDLELQEGEVRKLSNKVSKLIEIHKLKV